VLFKGVLPMKYQRMIVARRGEGSKADKLNLEYNF
jgi:hypothetical protein